MSDALTQYEQCIHFRRKRRDWPLLGCSMSTQQLSKLLPSSSSTFPKRVLLNWFFPEILTQDSIATNAFVFAIFAAAFLHSARINLWVFHVSQGKPSKINIHLTSSQPTGCKVPEPLMKEAYIMRPELSPMVGTGSQGILAFSGHGPGLRFWFFLATPDPWNLGSSCTTTEMTTHMLNMKN